VLLDFRCDANVPPLPPHSTRQQVRATAGAIAKGDEDSWQLTKQSVKQKASQYFSRTRS
jgi:pyruvate dehydrogenase (quinone)